MRKFIESEIMRGLARFSESGPDLADDMKRIAHFASLLIEKKIRGEDIREGIAHFKAQLANVEAVYSIRAGKELEAILGTITEKLAGAITDVAIASIRSGCFF